MIEPLRRGGSNEYSQSMVSNKNKTHCTPKFHYIKPGFKGVLISWICNFVLLIVPSRYFCGGSFCFMSWCFKIFCDFVMYVFIF